MSPRFTAVLDRNRSSGAPVVASPPAVRVQRRWWRDSRVVLGSLLVIVCMVVGARLMTMGADTTDVWQVERDLAAGATLTSEDLVPVSIESSLVDAYVRASEFPAGRLVRNVAAGEMLPLAAIGSQVPTDVRWVSVPLEPLHAPADLAPGERVDVWATPDASRSLEIVAEPELVLAGALVAAIDVEARGFAGDYGVVIEVAPEQAQSVLAAVRGGMIDLVRVPVGAEIEVAP